MLKNQPNKKIEIIEIYRAKLCRIQRDRRHQTLIELGSVRQSLHNLLEDRAFNEKKLRDELHKLIEKTKSIEASRSRMTKIKRKVLIALSLFASFCFIILSVKPIFAFEQFEYQASLASIISLFLAIALSVLAVFEK